MQGLDVFKKDCASAGYIDCVEVKSTSIGFHAVHQKSSSLLHLFEFHSQITSCHIENKQWETHFNLARVKNHL